MAVLDPGSGKVIVRLDRHDHSVFAAAFCRDGTRLATASMDRTGSIWDARLGDRFEVMPDHPGPWYTISNAQLHKDAPGERAVRANRHNGTSVFRTSAPHAEIVALVDVERGMEDAGFVDGSDWDGAAIDVSSDVSDARDIIWTNDRSSIGGIALWDVTRSRVLLLPPAVAIAAALAAGIGRLTGNEQEGILLRSAPDDLYRALREAVPAEWEYLVESAAQLLRTKQHPGCYRADTANRED